MSRFSETVLYLRAEAQKLLDAAANLEALDTGRTSGRRGRKFMGAEERQLVSLRMRRYWASRRKAATHVA